MAQPFDKPQSRVTDLPNPELNPLLNPILGRNLGRWAQVYFTSPPEKREEAVIELLRELEGNPVTAGSPTDLPSPLSQTMKAQTVPEFASCPECSQPNGKWQRYCGMCGARIAADEKPERQDAFPGNGHHEPEKAVASVSEKEQYPTLSLFATAEPESGSWASEGDGTSHAKWLRDGGFVSDSNEEGSKIGVYALAACSILVLAGVIFYAQFRSQRTVVQDLRPIPVVTTQEAGSQQSPPQQASTPQAKGPESSATQSPAPQTSPSNSTAAPAQPPVNEHASAPPTQPEGSPASPAQPATLRNVPSTTPSHAASNAVRSAAEPSPAAAPETSSPSVGEKPVGGSLELATAQQYLSGKGRPRDSAAAATWLWAAVRKENPIAVLLLSQLYLAGDGVTKNCEQARVLLMSAVRKNVPGAATQLNNVQAAGCK